MVGSIAITGRYDLRLSGNALVFENGEEIKLKDMPFVRYRFEEYGDADIQYIKDSIKKFEYSAHLAEVNLNSQTVQIVERLRAEVPNLAIYVYTDIDNVSSKQGVNNETQLLLSGLRFINLDRIMLRDKTTNMANEDVLKLKSQVAELTGYMQKDIGICGGPLSFKGDACLTAVKARELSAKYCKNALAATPSSNHEGKGNCGCIQYIEVNNHIKEVYRSKAESTGEKAKANSTGGSKEKQEKRSTFVLRRF